MLEVVGPTLADESGKAAPAGPASIWGLALTTDDMDATVSSAEPNISAPKPAVQPGRQIATINTKALDISTAIAVMTPHVSPTAGSPPSLSSSRSSSSSSPPSSSPPSSSPDQPAEEG